MFHSINVKNLIRTTFTVFVLSFFCLTPSNGLAQSPDQKWISLFNGNDLKDWDTYLGPHFGPGVSWENIKEKPALGTNHDPKGVFSVVELEGENVLRISGEGWGGIFTKQAYGNYHLKLQFKWGEKKWYPREKESDKRDSGLLYHGIGKHGEDDMFWLKSQEFQVQEGDCGDFWGVGGTIIDVRAKLMEDGETYIYDAQGPLLTFSKTSEFGRHCKKNPDMEKPSGQWNTLELYCFGGTSVHLVNGKVTMVLENSRHTVNGEEVPLTKGMIEIQSESAEVFYRDIQLRSIDGIPEGLLKGE